MDRMVKPTYKTDIIKLYCGGCLDVLETFEDNSVDLMITSPPYPGVSNMWGDLYKPENFTQAHEFLSTVWDECLRVLRPGCKLCINVANTKRRPYLPNTHKIYEWAEDKCEALGEIIWHKGYGQCGTAWGSYCNPSDPALADQHEYILIFRKFGTHNKRKGYFLNPRDFKSWRNSIWKIPPAKAKKMKHIAPFPLEIPKRLILLYSYPDEIVLDPFMGSGTTGLAATDFGRQFIGIDHKEEYIELAKQNIRANQDQQKLYFYDVAEVKKAVKNADLFEVLK